MLWRQNIFQKSSSISTKVTVKIICASLLQELMSYSSPLFFATSGIRGKANTIISPELGLRVGRAVATWLKSQNFEKILVYVGFDTRRNSKTIARTITAGLSSSGIDCKAFIKPVPTPLVVHATERSEAQAGIMITGSHLPRDENGIILFDGAGNYYKGILPDSLVDPVKWDELGKIETTEIEIDDYITFLSQIVKAEKLKKIGWNILVDPVHGPMKDYLELTLVQFVDNLIKFNWSDDDTFSGRLSEPTPKNLEKTSKAVIVSDCDLGIATDMDGDRVIYITSSGQVISGDYVGAILAKWAWEQYPDSPVIVPINTSAIINYMAEEMNGKLIYCKVGPPSIIDAIRTHEAKFGFEETGKYFFSDYAIWPDAVVSTIMLLSYLQDKDQRLSDIVEKMPKLYSLKSKIPSLRETGETTILKIKEKLTNEFDNITEINDMDGLRINFSDKSWLLIRQSGTEDYMRIFSEHSDEQKNEQLNQRAQEIVNHIIED